MQHPGDISKRSTNLHSKMKAYTDKVDAPSAVYMVYVVETNIYGRRKEDSDRSNSREHATMKD